MTSGERRNKTKRLLFIIIPTLISLIVQATGAAGGPFGPPQPVSREAGGLHTAIGAWHEVSKFKNERDHIVRRRQVYSHAGYGARNRWEVYGRIGLSDLKISDAFGSTSASTIAAKDDFEDNFNLFAALGLKYFYPCTKTFGIGAFIQGAYYFHDYIDEVSGVRSGVPFTMEILVENLWDVHIGIGLQAEAWHDTKLYAGPFLRYSEAKASPSANFPGLEFSAGKTTVRNDGILGGFAGLTSPLGKGFHLNVEGQYSGRLSAGAAVVYKY